MVQRVTWVVLPGQGIEFGPAAGAPLYSATLASVAQEVLGLDVTRLTPSQLGKTQFAQLAIEVRALDAVCRARNVHPELFQSDTKLVFAGLSVGEVAAVAAAGRLSLKDALRVAKVRAAAMARACDEHPGAMVTLHGVKNEGLIPCAIAARLFPFCVTVAGPREDLASISWTPEIASRAVPQKGLGGAFHTASMRHVAERIAALALSCDFSQQQQQQQQQQPSVTCVDEVFSNVTGQLYKPDDDTLASLAQQVVATVQWESILGAIVADPRPGTILDIGSGGQLRAMLQRFQSPIKNKMLVEEPLAVNM